MVQYTIEAALNSKTFNRVVVSTDIPLIDFMERLPDRINERIEVRARNKKLASDTATTFDICNNLFKEIQKDSKSNCPICAKEKLPDSFALLLATSPLRTAEDIQRAHKVFQKSGAGCLMSISAIDYPEEWTFTIDKNKIYRKGSYDIKRQELEQHYKHDGSIIMCKTKEFLEVEDWMWMNPIPWLTPPERAIDINTIEDFQYAEYLLSGVV